MKTGAPPARTRLPLSQRGVLAVLMLFVAAEVFSGVLRYGFAQAGAPWLTYMPKLLTAVTVLGTLIFPVYLCHIRALLRSIMSFGLYLAYWDDQ